MSHGNATPFETAACNPQLYVSQYELTQGGLSTAYIALVKQLGRDKATLYRHGDARRIQNIDMSIQQLVETYLLANMVSIALSNPSALLIPKELSLLDSSSPTRYTEVNV